MAEGPYCPPTDHRYFVVRSEVMDGVDEAIIYVILACTACGYGRVNEHKVQRLKEN